MREKYNSILSTPRGRYRYIGLSLIVMDDQLIISVTGDYAFTQACQQADESLGLCAYCIYSIEIRP